MYFLAYSTLASKKETCPNCVSTAVLDKLKTLSPEEMKIIQIILNWMASRGSITLHF